jgi:DNA-binding transcriptional LysR family regulator
MITYTLRQLTYFVAAADHGSVAKAARALNVSQPSVSMAIAKLEGLFGVQLFLRHHAHGVSTTPAGRPLLAEARSLLAHAGELAERAQGLGAGVTGRLDVGCYLTLAPFFMPRIVAGFTKAHPDVEIALHEGHQDELLDGMAAGRHTVALIYDVDLPGHVEAEALVDLPPYALLPAGHALAASPTVALADLVREPLVLLDVPPGREYFTSLFTRAGLEPDIRFRSASIETVRGMVASGLGVSLLVTRPAGDLAYDGQGVACRPLTDPVEPGHIVLARLAQSRPTRLVETFAAHCRCYFAGEGGAEKWDRS